MPPIPQPTLTAAPVLVTGATGYIGGRLIPHLLEAGYRVRVLTRGGAGRLAGRPWAGQVEIVDGDVLKPGTLAPALAGVQSAYYLVHSMKSGPQFHQRDLQAAANFGRAAAQAGVNRIIYLSGLGEPDSQLSEHLRSRHDTGQALREAGLPVTEFRAAIVVGSGSISFEMIRYLVERLPAMICPRWVYTQVQPIAIRDLLNYLVAALTVPESAGRIIEIGGADVLTYGQMMERYAHVRGLYRLLIPVPLLTPRLSSYWVHLVTPIPANIARPLIDGLRNEVIVRDDLARQIFPQIEPLDYDAAVRAALDRLREGHVETVWSDALATTNDDLPPLFLTEEQGMIIERRRRPVAAPAAQVYRAFVTVGGQLGWFRYNWAWRLRGLLDRWLGGVGMRNSQTTPAELAPGKTLDFWRIEEIRPERMIRLRAEMKLPGRGWLQFEAKDGPDGRTELIQTAFFDPKGLLGLVYWYGLLPVHRLIFSNMIGEIADRAEQLAAGRALAEIVAERRSVERQATAGLGLALLLPVVIGGLSGLATRPALTTWYPRLKKPAWIPPSWLFGPVWILLYLLMGLASWLVWRRRAAQPERARPALIGYGIQLGLNGLWSLLFFGMQRVDLALIEIVALWSAILITIFNFAAIRRGAAWLLLPYQLWVTFAAALNAVIWQLNRQR